MPTATYPPVGGLIRPARALDSPTHRLTDVYGHELAHYIDEEFRRPKVTVPFWRDYVDPSPM